MKISARRRARLCAAQAIYSWSISGNDVNEVALAFLSAPKVTDPELEDIDMHNADRVYFNKLLNGVVENVARIDEALRPYLDRAENDLDPIERSILRLSAYELLFELDVPYKVVINEGIEVAKVFGSDDSHKYINGLLDQLAPNLGRK